MPSFSSFSTVNVLVIALVKNCQKKSSTCDPIPTSLLKRYAERLAIPITTLVNMYLCTGFLPDEMKLAHLIPLLKKPSLCPDYLNNYRPVSLLSFLSKLVERLVGKQLTAHLTQHNLFVSVQLAYQQNHFTETTLLKVVKDLLFAIDGGNAAVLTLMDESVAFDTVDHANLLSRLTALFGISGTVYYSQISSCMSKT